MAQRKLGSAFLIALFVSGSCTVLLSRKTRIAAPPPQRKQRVVAAILPLEAGEVLKAGNLKLEDWPVSIPLTGAFLKPQDLVGRAILYPLAANEPILERDLSVPGMGLTVKIPEGMRALALRSDEVVGVAGFLFPGSHVDVLVTYHAVNSPEMTTATVLQDTQIVAVGHEVQPSPDGKAEAVNVVTLLMTPEDAERVVLASTQGNIHFVLRNSIDHIKVATSPVELSQLIPQTNEAPKRSAPTAIAQRPYVVETVMGDKEFATRFK